MPYRGLAVQFLSRAQDARYDLSMSDDQSKLRPVLTYPLEWEYRVIGASEVELRAVIVRVMGTREHSVAEPRRSREGRWVSLHVQLVVHTEEERDRLHGELRSDPAVRLVM